MGGSRFGWRTRHLREQILVGDFNVLLRIHLFSMLTRAILGERKGGDEVNLERAMGAHVRFGGHFVQVIYVYIALKSD